MASFLKRVQKNLRRNKREKKKELDLAAAAQLDVSGVETICLALGPYRSFTTVTASVIAEHPQCLAINHGGKVIFGDSRLDFLESHSPARADRFLQYAIHLSLGSENDASASGHRQVGAPRTVFWNESQRTANHLRRHNIQLERLFRKEPRLRFIQTIRHPIQTAFSHQKAGMTRHLGLGSHAPVEEVLDAILREIHWFMRLQHEHGGRFFHFFDYEFEADKAKKLAAFLQVEPDEKWIQLVSGRFASLAGNRPCAYPEPLLDRYVDGVTRTFDTFPEVQRGLLYYLEGSSKNALPGAFSAAK